MARFGSYVKFIIEPDTEEGKKEYVKIAVNKLLDQVFEYGHVPDWNTMELIIKEGIDFFTVDPTWYEGYDDEGNILGDHIPRLPHWTMTVGIKFEGKNDGTV